MCHKWNYIKICFKGAGPFSLTLPKALLIRFSEYLQLFNQFFNSFNPYSVFSSFETKTIICLARLYGTLSLECALSL